MYIYYIMEDVNVYILYNGRCQCILPYPKFVEEKPFGGRLNLPSPWYKKG